MTKLNEQLLIDQGVTEEQQEILQLLYVELEDLLNNPELYVEGRSPGEVQFIVDEIQQLEYDIQRNWNFEPDRNRHKYWLYVKGCKCSWDDNKLRWGTPYRVINQSCPWHGSSK